MHYNVEAIYDHGVFRPVEPLILPDGLRVQLRIEEKSGTAPAATAHVYSPRLAHPEQAIEFEMEVRELPDAGV